MNDRVNDTSQRLQDLIPDELKGNNFLATTQNIITHINDDVDESVENGTRDNIVSRFGETLTKGITGFVGGIDTNNDGVLNAEEINVILQDPKETERFFESLPEAMRPAIANICMN